MLLGLLIEVYTHCVQVLALFHQAVEILTSLEKVIQVLMHHILHFVELLFHFEQLISLGWVLPFLQKLVDVGVWQTLLVHVFHCVFIVPRTAREILSEVHD